MSEELLASERVFQGRLIGVRRDTVRLAGGGTATREVVEHRGAVAIVALEPDDTVLLVRQWRHPAGQELLEIPAGTLDPNETPERCAWRELQEETGRKPETLEPLGMVFLAPGYSSEKLYMFLATGLTESSLPHDDDEELSLVRLPLAEAARRAEAGEFADAKTVAGVLLAARRRGV